MTASPTPRSLDHALARHGAKMDADEFLAILAEATDSTDTITADEQALLIDNGGVSREAVTPEQQAIARRQIVVQSVRADAEAARVLSVAQDDDGAVIGGDDDGGVRTAPLGVVSGAVVGVVTGWASR